MKHKNTCFSVSVFIASVICFSQTDNMQSEVFHSVGNCHKHTFCFRKTHERSWWDRFEAHGVRPTHIDVFFMCFDFLQCGDIFLYVRTNDVWIWVYHALKPKPSAYFLIKIPLDTPTPMWGRKLKVIFKVYVCSLFS